MQRFSVILLVGALLFGVAFATAPFFAFRALKAAAQVEDVQAIGELVDFASVRHTLTAQLGNDPVRAEPPSIWKDPIGAIKGALEPLVPPEPKVDRYLTPAGLYALTRGYQPGTAPPAQAPPADAMGRLKAAAAEPVPSLLYWDPNRARFQVRRKDAPIGETTIFTFERKALFTWKLVHIGLPKGWR